VADVTTHGSAAAGSAPAPQAAPGAKRGKPGESLGTGRRKESVARVRMSKGSGTLTVNGRELDDYFVRDQERQEILNPLRAAKALGRFDIVCTVEGGGYAGQAGAIVLGIARALVKADTEAEPLLRAEGLLSRDARMKERKKYGQKGARARFQFSKR
jgi:small subunit ribosomal protein S9